MAYLTRQQFLDQSIPGEALTGLSTTQIDDALAWASDEADSYLGKRLVLPLISWGNDLRRKVGDLAQFNLLSRRGFRPGSGNDAIAEKRYDDAVRWLRDVSNGIVVPAGVVDSSPQLDEEGPLASSEPKTSFRTFTGSRGDPQGDL